MNHRRDERRALIKVDYGCNNHCLFCHTLDRRGEGESSEAVVRKIDRAASLGHTLVAFSGGEPTLRRELWGWARRLHALGLGLGLVSNGRALSYPEVIDRLTSLGLRYAHVSVHGATAQTHDALVRAEAFDQTLAAITQLAARGVELTVACVLTRQNLGELEQLVDRLAPLGHLTLKFAFTESKGGAARDFDAIIPSLSDAALAVGRALRHGVARYPNLDLRHEALPLCLVPGHEARADSLRAHGFVSMSEVGEADFFPVDEDARTHPRECEDCGLRGRCGGVFRGYLERRTDFAPRPVTRTRSNAFLYHPLRTLPWPAGATCPILADGTTPYHRGRTLFLLRGDELDHLETGTRDFTDDEIVRAKFEHGQIYARRSDAPAIQDFACDLALLEISPACTNCPARERCPRCYETTTEDVFRRDDRELRQHLATLRGDVLEIGCGRGRYLDTLAPAAERGELRYLGIDPDEMALATLEARFSWARTRRVAAESFVAEPHAVDHVLLLGSYQHLPFPDRVLPALTRALRPGGTLLIADDVAYGLVERRSAARVGDQDTPRFEHHRNHDGHAVHARLAALPLELSWRRDLAPGGTNLYILSYVRLEEPA